MYAIELTAPSPTLATFRRTTLAEPEVGHADVRVRMRAASLNFIDLAVANGAYPVPAFPLVPVADGAGEIVEVGKDVRDLAVGDRVIAHSKAAWIGGPFDSRLAARMRGLTLPGSLAELVVLPETALVPIPHHLDFAAAATLPTAATTAWNAIRVANVRVGSWVLLLGTGGVSLFALQLAKAAGARVVITSSSDAKLERARALGADATINYRTTPDWAPVVRELTGGHGADLVVETGGAATFDASLDAAADGGSVFAIGFLSGSRAEVDVLRIITKALRVHGNNTGSVSDLRDAVRAVAAAKLVPVVDRRFGLEEASAAYRHLASGGHFGKIVIEHTT